MAPADPKLGRLPRTTHSLRHMGSGERAARNLGELATSASKYFATSAMTALSVRLGDTAHLTSITSRFLVQQHPGGCFLSVVGWTISNRCSMWRRGQGCCPQGWNKLACAATEDLGRRPRTKEGGLGVHLWDVCTTHQPAASCFWSISSLALPSAGVYWLGLIGVSEVPGQSVTAWR